MTIVAAAQSIPCLLAAAFVGFVGGLAYFAVLRRSVSLLAGDGIWTAPALLTLGRLLGIVGLLYAMAKLGPGALLASFLGFIIARMVMMRGGRAA